MTTWVYFDAKGRRAPARLAKFKAWEVIVVSGAPAPRDAASPSRYEYREVHAIEEPSAVKTFESAKEMKKWFAEHGRPGTKPAQ